MQHGCVTPAIWPSFARVLSGKSHAGGRGAIPFQRREANVPKLNAETETKAAFAARVGLTRGRISQLVADGLPVRGDGRIDVEAGLAWMEQNLDPAKRNKGGSMKTENNSPSLAEARRLHLIVQVQRAKLALEQERGRLIDADEATATVFARARAERDAHIAWVQRCAPLIAGELGADPNRTFAVLDRLMREHLDYLSETPLESLRDAGSH
jgi:hypothetical protein